MDASDIYMAVTLGLTAAQGLCRLARFVASKTASPSDDAAVGAVERFLTAAESYLGVFALRLGRK